MLRIETPWNSYQNKSDFIYGNAYENAVREMATILAELTDTLSALFCLDLLYIGYINILSGFVSKFLRLLPWNWYEYPSFVQPYTHE